MHQALEQSPALRRMLQSPEVGELSLNNSSASRPAPVADEARGSDAAASPSTPAANPRVSAPGWQEADGVHGGGPLGGHRRREALGGAPSEGGAAEVSGSEQAGAETLSPGTLGGGGDRSDSGAEVGGTGRDTTGKTRGASNRGDLQAVVLGHHMLDFWTNVCVCHMLIVESGVDHDQPPVYQV